MAGSGSTDTDSWYSRGLDRIYDGLDTGSDGLSTEEADRRLSEHGPNRLPKAKPVTVWQIFLRQFENPLIYILAIAAIVSFAIGAETDAGFIAAVLSFCEERIPPFTVGVNPTTPPQPTDNTLPGYSTPIHTVK